MHAGNMFFQTTPCDRLFSATAGLLIHTSMKAYINQFTSKSSDITTVYCTRTSCLLIGGMIIITSYGHVLAMDAVVDSPPTV